MRIEPIEPIPGAFTVTGEPVEDERGWFVRTFDADAFAAHGIDPTVQQCSVSFNLADSTLRGMHFQQAPAGEAKLVRCTRGRVFDVLVDARRGSSTRGSWSGHELSDGDHLALYLPPGVAHGFLTLAPASEVSYQISVPYRADLSCGFRWDDPDVGIAWPRQPAVLSARDRSLPPLRDTGYEEAL